MKHFAVVPVLISAVLFALSNAGRLSDVARRGGFTRQLLGRQVQPRQAVNTTDYRFYSNATARESSWNILLQTNT